MTRRDLFIAVGAGLLSRKRAELLATQSETARPGAALDVNSDIGFLLRNHANNRTPLLSLMLNYQEPQEVQSPTYDWRDPNGVLRWTYTQIFRTNIKAKGPKALRKAIEEHKASLNVIALFGSALEHRLPRGTFRTTKGVIYSVPESNKARTLQNFVGAAFRYGLPQKLLIASPSVAQQCREEFPCSGPHRIFGVELWRLQTGQGVWELAEDEALGTAVPETPIGAVSVDLDTCGICYLEGRLAEMFAGSDEENGDYGDGPIRKLDPQIISELGFWWKDEKRFAKLVN